MCPLNVGVLLSVLLSSLTLCPADSNLPEPRAPRSPLLAQGSAPPRFPTCNCMILFGCPTSTSKSIGSQTYLTIFLPNPLFLTGPLLLYVAPLFLPQVLSVSPRVIISQDPSKLSLPRDPSASIRVFSLLSCPRCHLLAVPCLRLELASPGLQCSQTLSKTCNPCLYTFHGSPVPVVNTPGAASPPGRAPPLPIPALSFQMVV